MGFHPDKKKEKQEFEQIAVISSAIEDKNKTKTRINKFDELQLHRLLLQVR